MNEKKYSKILTILLVIIIIAVIGLLGFLGYTYYKKNTIIDSASNFVDNFEKQQIATETEPEREINTGNQSTSNNNTLSVEIPAENQQGSSTSTDANASTNTGSTTTTTKPEDSQTPSSSNSVKKQMYKGFEMCGTISIPKTKLKYPILTRLSPKALDTAVVVEYPKDPVLNEVGNIVIAGHNYRNGTFFSNNYKLAKGDKINITDLNKKTVTYVIYKIFETSDTNTEFYNRDTNGKREITLKTCTNNAQARLIIQAAEE